MKALARALYSHMLPPVRSLLSILCLSACGSAPASPAAKPVVEVKVAAPSAPSAAAADLPRTIGLDGVYSVEHEVGYVCDNPDWCTADVTDTLRIIQDGDALQIQINLVQTNYHVCGWEGSMTAIEDSKWGAHIDECSVRLTVKPEKLLITSDGCAEYCGARAYLEADFPRSPAPLDGSLETPATAETGRD